jgi:hypothetical protein
MHNAGDATSKVEKPKRRYIGSNSLENILPGAEANGGRRRNVANQPLLQPVVLGKRVSKQTVPWSESNGEQSGRRWDPACMLTCDFSAFYFLEYSHRITSPCFL